MLVFIDESGDSGLKIGRGSSKFFVIALIVFEDNKEAEECDKRIELLKGELDWRHNQEFHFKRNSDKVRKLFLDTISASQFFYYAIVLNKKGLWGDGFKDKKSFYKYSCSLVFENAKDKLDDATIVIDESGSLDFKRQLEKYLKSKMNSKSRKIKKVKMQRSTSNNLLQIADYVAGVVNRSVSCDRKSHDVYRKMLSHREMYVQIWPKIKNS